MISPALSGLLAIALLVLAVWDVATGRLSGAIMLCASVIAVVALRTGRR